MFIDHFYFQFLLKQKVSMEPVQNGRGSMFCVHVTGQNDWPTQNLSLILSLKLSYCWTLFICILFIVHFYFLIFFFLRGGRTRSITGGPWARSIKWSTDPIQNGGSMAHDWNLRKGKINQWWWMMNEWWWTSTVYASRHRLHLWPFDRFLTLQNVTKGQCPTLNTEWIII